MIQLVGIRHASSVPLLREACASWYYESPRGVNGPVSTQILSDLLCNNYNSEEGGKLDMTARVYPSESNGNEGVGSGKWARIQDYPYLLLAIETLSEVTTMPTAWPANDDETCTQQVDTTTYYYDRDKNNDQGNQDDDGITKQKVMDEFEAFLSSTDHLAPHAAGAGGAAAAATNESDNEEYESDGGTRYVRDSRTGNWIHKYLAPKREKTKETKNEG
jgi:hypothetical protein